MHRPKRLGIVGPLASGKTVVLGMFAELGAASIAADDVSRDLLQPGSELLARVIEVFGRQYQRPDGSLDRAALGRLIFADDEARRRLEALTHPPMLEEMRRRVEEAERTGVPLIVVEAAVLYVMGADKLVDRVVLVTADRQERLRRLMQRDGLTREEAERRLQLHERCGLDQPPADYVIDTTQGLGQTRRQVEALWRKLVDEATPG
ncbi:MAG: dephospho-CoA kinase [Armatimonadetes bacterium]|nr:dephospho-CoA kinase [Armatimonadota bacterium]